MRVIDPEFISLAGTAVQNGQSLRRWARELSYGAEVRTGITTTPRQQRDADKRRKSKAARKSRKKNRS